MVIAAYPLALYQSKLLVHLFFQFIDTLELRYFSQSLVYSLHLFQAVPRLLRFDTVLIPFDLHQPFHFQFHKLVHKVPFSCLFKILFPEYDRAFSAHTFLPVHSTLLVFLDNTFQRCIHKRLPLPFYNDGYYNVSANSSPSSISCISSTKRSRSNSWMDMDFLLGFAKTKVLSTFST